VLFLEQHKPNTTLVCPSAIMLRAWISIGAVPRRCRTATTALFGCIKFTDVKFTGEFFQNFTNPSFPKVYTAEPIYCLPDEVFALFNACQGTACMMHARLHAACKFACPPCKLHGTRWHICKQFIEVQMVQKNNVWKPSKKLLQY